MSVLTNQALQSVFGCPNSSETYVINVVGASGSLILDPNEMYRLTTTTDCFISFDKEAYSLQTSASGVRMFPCVPEVFMTTSDHIYVNTLQDTDGGAMTGQLTITKMLRKAV